MSEKKDSWLRILSWVQAQTGDSPTGAAKTTEYGGLPTPPPSDRSMRRTESPPKRARVDAVLDQDRTPTPSRSYDVPDLVSQLSNPPSLAASESSSRRAANPTRRAGSPLKRYHLEALKKRVVYTALDDNANRQLLADSQRLYDLVYKIAEEHETFLPHQIRSEICDVTGRNIKDSWFTKPEQGSDVMGQHERERSRAMYELWSVQKIVSKTRSCQECSRSESACNMDMHGPVLELALEPYNSVERELVTTARILAPFIPITGTATIPVESKMVDFAIVLDLNKPDASDADRLLAGLIRGKVLSQPTEMQSVNHTSYAPLQFRPAASLIETKASGSPEEGRLQLAVATAALHQRLESFLGAKFASQSDKPPLIPTLPQIPVIVATSWR